MTYPVEEVPSGVLAQLEQLGTKGKFWYRDSSGKRVLFKEGRPGTGENWAEKIACEIAELLGLPPGSGKTRSVSAVSRPASHESRVLESTRVRVRDVEG